MKNPKSKEEVNELRKNLRSELSWDDLEIVAGGNDDVKGSDEGTWVECPYCHQMVHIVKAGDGPKHMTQECPNNPCN